MEFPVNATLVDANDIYSVYELSGIQYTICLPDKTLELSKFNVAGEKMYFDHIDYDDGKKELSLGFLKFPYGYLEKYGDDGDNMIQFADVKLYDITVTISVEIKKDIAVLEFWLDDGLSIHLDRKLLQGILDQNPNATSDRIYHCNKEATINLSSDDNLTMWQKYINGKYPMYDYIGPEDIKVVIGPKTYSIFRYEDNNVFIFGEQHVLHNKSKYDMTHTMMFPMYLKTMLDMYADCPVQIYIELQDISPPKKLENMIACTMDLLLNTSINANTILIAADKRYDLNIKERDWFRLYQTIGITVTGLGIDLQALKTKVSANDIFTTDIIDIIREEQEIVLQHIKEKYGETDQYEEILAFYKTSTNITNITNITLDQLDTMKGLADVIQKLNCIIDLYNPLMDLFILDGVLKANNDSIIYVGYNHVSLYEDILQKAGAKKVYNSNYLNDDRVQSDSCVFDMISEAHNTWCDSKKQEEI